MAKILLVEDDILTRKFTKPAIQAEGYDIVSAKTVKKR